MTKQQIAIVLPAEWIEFRDENNSPIVSTELRETLDQIAEVHPDFELVGMFHGSQEAKYSPIYPRLYIERSGHIGMYSSGVGRVDPGRSVGENIDALRQSGVPATIKAAMTTYSRKFHEVARIMGRSD